MRAGQRDLDIVIYGASGFAGSLTARYLAAVGGGIRIGLAGRSAERLEAVRRTAGAGAANWPLIVAGLAAPEALQEMAARTRVVLSTVGPYHKHGLPVVAACAAAGTDYADLTGEVPFVRKSIDLYHGLAAQSGARIVHSCGFDSIPSDMGVYALHRRVVDDDAGELGDTTFVLRAYSGGGSSGGTVATMIELMRAPANDPEMRRVVDDPYSLSPDRGAEPEFGPQPDMPLLRGSDIAPELAGLWAGGYLMALYNTRCVRRSNALLDFAYGRELRYRETMSMGSWFAAPLVAAMSSATVVGASKFGGRYLDMVPPGLIERLSPAPGTGFDQGSHGHYRVETYTTTTTGARYMAAVAQRGDPGYAATGVLFGQSALALALDRDALSDLRGVLTPASSMGDVLLKRLPAAGVTITTTRLN